MESEEEEDQKLDIVTRLKKLQMAEVSLICTGWCRTEDYGEPWRFINLNFPLDDDDCCCLSLHKMKFSLKVSKIELNLLNNR